MPDPLAEKIASFISLEKNWDSCGAEPPTPASMLMAVLFLEQLHVAPTPDGGIFFESTFGHSRLAFEINASGHAECVEFEAFRG